MDAKNRQELVGPVRERREWRRGQEIQLQAVATLASGPTTATSFEAFFAEIVRTVVREELAAIALAASPSLASGAPAPEYLTIGRAAEIANVHACTIRAWIKDGSLHAYRCGGRGYRIQRSDLDARLTVETADPTNEQIRGRVDAILAKQRAKRRAA